MVIDVVANRENLHVFDDLAALSAAAAAQLATLSREAISARGRFTLALSGGSTPKKLYEILARDYSKKIDWSKVFLFWTDERYVPHNDPLSNYRLVKESLIDHVPIPARNVFPIPTRWNPQLAAEEYRRILLHFFGTDLFFGINFPSFDLVLLGLGPDGHVASLFPTTDFESHAGKLVVVTEPNVAPFVTRISMTLEVLNAAKNAFFLVVGEEKAGILNAVLDDRQDRGQLYPASRLKSNENIRWFVDNFLIGEK